MDMLRALGKATWALMITPERFLTMVMAAARYQRQDDAFHAGWRAGLRLGIDHPDAAREALDRLDT